MNAVYVRLQNLEREQSLDLQPPFLQGKGSVTGREKPGRKLCLSMPQHSQILASKRQRAKNIAGEQFQEKPALAMRCYPCQRVQRQSK